MAAPDTRAKRLREIRKIFVLTALHNDTADYNKLVSTLANDWDADPRKIKEYLKILEESGFIKIEKNKDFKTRLAWLNLDNYDARVAYESVNSDQAVLQI